MNRDKNRPSLFHFCVADECMVRPDQARHADRAAGPAAAAPDADVLRLRTVHRAAAELRRGTPVLLTRRGAADPAGGRDGRATRSGGIRRAGGGAARAAAGADARGRGAASARSSRGSRRRTAISAPSCWRRSRCAVWPTPRWRSCCRREPEPAPAPVLAPAALVLAKLGRLLPAVLAAPVRPDAAGRTAAVRPVQRAGSRSDRLSGRRGGRPAADRLGARAAGECDRFARDRLPHRGIGDRAPGHHRRPAGEGGRAAGAHPFRVLHRRSAGQPALRLRRRSCAARSRAWPRRAPASLLYLAQEGRNIGLVNKLRAYTLAGSRPRHVGREPRARLGRG